jgi:hypothetical protein
MAGETARLRERLFDDYSERLARVRPGLAATFICPLCQKPFTRDALAGDQPALTLAHVLPEALGGSFCTLTCTPCNNDMGSDLEAFLLERFRAEDAMKGVGTMAGRLEGAFGSVGVEFQVAPPGEPWTIIVIDKQTNPAVLRNLDESLDAPAASGAAQVSSGIKPRFRHRPNRVSAAIYQSAFLLMFAYFSYEFAFDPRYAKLREQILKPDEEILPGVFDLPPDSWCNQHLSADRPHLVLFVKEPSPFIMPVFRLCPKGGLPRVVGVPLPGLDDSAWPPGPRGRVKGVIVRFRSEKDDGTRPDIRQLWEQAKKMA